MKKNVVASIGMGLVLLAVLRTKINIPVEIFLGISAYTFFLSFGQMFYNLRTLLPKQENKSGKKNKTIIIAKIMIAIGDYMIFASVVISIMTVVIITHMGNQMVTKFADVFTLLSLAVTFLLISLYEKD